jgi:hypothetical protein
MVNIFEERIKNYLGNMLFENIKLNVALELAQEKINELEKTQTPVQE